jgi:hypothetical protein
VDELRKFAASSNGDRWFLGRDAETGSAFVLHKANRPSGGKVTELPIEAFLSGNPDAPERRALLQLIGSLAASAGQDFEGEDAPPPVGGELHPSK